MPIPAVKVSKRPPDGFPAQTMIDVRVIVDISVVVVVDETEPQRLTENSPNHHREPDANGE